MDNGGKLFKNPRLVDLFEHYGFAAYPSGFDASYQNGPCERAHLTVANGVCTLLDGASLSTRFWPFAFDHFLCLHNAFSSQTKTHSPIELVYGRRENFKRLRWFGCRVWVRPPGKRKYKLRCNAIKGTFLGFSPDSLRKVIYHDAITDQVKRAAKFSF